MKIVVDTNIFVSAVISPSAPITRVVDACLDRTVTLVLSAPLIQEITEVLYRPTIRRQHGLSDAEIQRYIAQWTLLAEKVPGVVSVQVSPDLDDNMLFACAVEGKAAYLISGNTKHVLFIPEYQA